MGGAKTLHLLLFILCSKCYHKHVEEIQVFEFLVGLNPSFEQIRVQILNMALPLTLNEVYAYVHREEG